MKATISREKKKEIMRMKSIGVLVLAVLSLAFMCGYAYAISGYCSSCHTMHNTQGIDSDVTDSGPQERLVKSTCLGCHQGAAGATTADGAPIVFHTTNPGNLATDQGAGKTLAGGDFYWVATSGGGTDETGHNVSELANVDAYIGKTPPGWDQTATSGMPDFNGKTMQVTGGIGWGATQLTCAGTFGCHGTRDQTGLGGIQGSHHNNVTDATTPSTVADSYRFLANIKGVENANWNFTETQVSHNEYYGVNSVADRNYNAVTTTYTDKQTISFLCAECHGLFHSKAANDAAYASGDPWRRHPTDITLPASGEYNSYNPDDGGLYSLEVPVARGDVSGNSSSDVVLEGSTGATGAIVMCLSCHRAHGSPRADMLRFDYAGVTQVGIGNADTGCFTCHTAKNAD